MWGYVVGKGELVLAMSSLFLRVSTLKSHPAEFGTVTACTPESRSVSHECRLFPGSTKPPWNISSTIRACSDRRSWIFAFISYDAVHVALCLAQILLTSRTVFCLKVRFRVMNLSVAPELRKSNLLRQQKAQFCIVVVIAGWSTSSYRQLETVVWQRSPETNREREGGARNYIVESTVYLNPHLNLKQGFPLFLSLVENYNIK